MIRLSVAIPDSDAWLLKAIEAAKRTGAQSGPTPSIGSIVRDILKEHFKGFRPPDPLDLELQAKRANGYCFDPLPLP